MKRIAAIVLAALLVLCAAVGLAEDTQWCYYDAPEGVVLYSLSEFSTDLAPEGLEAMYASMADATDDSYVHIFRMPNGRALVSVATYSDPNHGTVQDLYDNWDALAANLGQDALSFNRDISCVSIEERYGFEALCINTEMVPADAPGLTIVMEGTVIFDGIDMMETWAVYPVETSAAAIPLLQSDLKALRELQASFEFVGEKADSQTTVESDDSSWDGWSWDFDDESSEDDSNWADALNGFLTTPQPEQEVLPVENELDSLGLIFSNGETPEPETEDNFDLGLFLQLPTPEPEVTQAPSGGSLFFAPTTTEAPASDLPSFDSPEMQSAWRYTDPEGWYTICLPEDTVVVTPAFTDAEIDAERQRWQDLYQDGAALFDLFCEDMDVYDFHVISCPKYGLALQISHDDSSYFSTFTVQDYMNLREAVCDNLAETFGSADLLDATGVENIAGVDHAAMAYYVRHEDHPMMAAIYAATDNNGVMRELDLFMVSGDDGLINNAYSVMLEEILDTLEYLK